MKPRIYITKKIPPAVEAFIAVNCEYRKWSENGPIPRDKLLEEVADIQGLLTHGYQIDEALLDRAPQLRIVSNMSVGYNNFDLKAMTKRGVIGTNTPGVLDETVADLVFALILSAGRRIVELDRFVKEGKWDKLIGEAFYGVDIHHKTLGIIGLGRIGETICRRARNGFQMNILYHNRSRNEGAEKEYGAIYCTMADLLRQADYVLLMTPLSPETYQLMGQREFGMMKKSAIFINASRGETVDEAALFHALKNKVILGAALDVYHNEPVQSHPLLTLPNIVTVPHIGSAVQETRDAMAMLAAENLVKGLKGERPPNAVN